MLKLFNAVARGGTMALFFKSLLKSFTGRDQNNSRMTEALSFDGLNPLLAKQLSELESQIGQLVQVQFELNQERRQMRTEMDSLKQTILAAQARPADAPLVRSPNESL
jgi:peptidoglycan hydrolase CwlO-like protein